MTTKDDPMDVIDLAQRLIRTPSPVRDGDERAVADVVQAALAEAGLPRASVLALHSDRPNLHLTVEFGQGGHHLALVGHIDTKPVGDARWTVDPFGAETDGERLYGLGSADMKGAVAAMIVAAGRLVADPPARGRLTLVFTADEEDGAVYGARYLATALPLDADALVIGEPGGIHDDYDGLHLVSRGLARFTLTARARQGHSSLSALLGLRNAGVDLARAIADLPAIDVSVPDNDDGLRDWSATVNPGLDVWGGYGYGVLAEQMAASVEVRTLPGMDDDRLLSELRARVDQTASATGADLSLDYDDSARRWIGGTRVRADDPLVAAVRAATEHVLGIAPPLSVFPGTTDTSWFAEADPSLPCLPALGPGLLRHAHGADEWVSVDAVRAAVDLYDVLARDFCSSPQTSAGARVGETVRGGAR